MALSPIMVELRGDISNFTAAMGKAKAETAKLQTGAAQHMKQLEAVGKAAFLGLAGAAVIGGVAAVKAAANYQESLTQLVTGAGESEKNIKMVGDGMLAMAGKVGISADDLSKGMYLIESSGQHGAAGLLVLKAAAEGAKVGNADMASVANGLTTALNDYRIPASQAATVTSQLVATVAAGKTHMADLASSLATVLPAASSAHLGLTQVLGAMATMTSLGTPAADAATYLKQTIANLSNPTAKAAHEMKGLGLSSIDISSHLGARGLTGTLGILTDAIQKKMGPAGTVLIESLKKSAGSTTAFQKILANLPPTQQTFIGALATMVGGTKSMQAALELTGKNARVFAGNVKAISGTTTEAGGHVKGFALTQKDLNTQIANAKAAFHSLMIEVGEKLIPVITAAIDWAKKHKGILELLAGVIGGALLVAIGAFVAGFIAANAAALAIGAAIAGVVLGLKYLWDHFSSVRHIVTAVVKTLREDLGRAFHWLSGTLLPNLQKAWDVAWGGVRKVIDGAVKFVRKLLADFAVFWKAHGAAITTIATHAWNLVKTTVTTAVKVMVDLIRPPLEIMKSIFKVAWDVVKGVIKTAWDLIGGTVRTGLKFIENVIGLFSDLLTGHWSKLWGDVKKLVGDAISGIGSILGRFAKDALGMLWQAGKDLIMGLINGVGSMAGALGNAVSDVAKGAINSVKSIFGINSPSKVFHEMGINVGLGLVNGLAVHKNLVAASAAELARMASVSAAGTLTMNLASGPGLGGRIVGVSQGSQVAAPIENHIHVHLDGKQIHATVQTHELQYQQRNGRRSA